MLGPVREVDSKSKEDSYFQFFKASSLEWKLPFQFIFPKPTCSLFWDRDGNYTATTEKVLLFHILFCFPGILFAKLKAKQMTAGMRVWN